MFVYPIDLRPVSGVCVCFSLVSFTQNAGRCGRSAHVDAPPRLVADGAHGRQSADAAAGRRCDARTDVAASAACRHHQRPQELRANPNTTEAGRHNVSVVCACVCVFVGGHYNA